MESSNYKKKRNYNGKRRVEGLKFQVSQREV
jgi:hypothetical protein